MTRSPDIVMSDEPETPEVLAAAILKISDGVEKLLESGVNHRAIVVLLADSSRVKRSDIEKILGALKDMKRDYCR